MGRSEVSMAIFMYIREYFCRTETECISGEFASMSNYKIIAITGLSWAQSSVANTILEVERSLWN